jgi:cellulose synthase (UDP-forming)
VKHRLPDEGQEPSVWLRLSILISAGLGINYVVWRWLFSVNWEAWWIAVPLVLAETYSLIDSLLFALTMWRLKRRPAPPVPPPDLSVDVYVTTFNEPVSMVVGTAAAATRIRYPHQTWILDDGNRPELASAAAELGVGYITRSPHWEDKPRHAKAGNLSNALLETTGEFILVLDADQVPEPEILDRTLGYFYDPKMALVQTPQYFVNVPSGDPLGAQAPLFYGPIQQGKDGWNAAYFCGTNAVLRRETLMLLGVRGYVRAIEEGVQRALFAADRIIRRSRKSLPRDRGPADEALIAVQQAVSAARRELADDKPVGEVTYRFQQRIDAAAQVVVAADATSIRADLAAIGVIDSTTGNAEAVLFDDTALRTLSGRELSPLGALDSISALVRAVDVSRDDEAQPLLPMATISVTEDMATCMRMHAHGWKTAYHHEVLAYGLAPDDIRTMLAQRLRWAQGTVQVLLRENPLLQKGLSIGQKLMYWATMWSYFAGFAAVAYIVAPAVYLIFGVMPVQAYSWDFFGRLIPFLVINQLIFLIVSRGTPTWRGQQYSLALFPVWIRACYTAIMNVYFDRPLGFAVTDKTPQEPGLIPWRLIKWQIAAISMLVIASVIGIVHLQSGAISVLGVGVNLFWVVFDIGILSVVIRAAHYRGHDPGEVGDSP